MIAVFLFQRYHHFLNKEFSTFKDSIFSIPRHPLGGQKSHTRLDPQRGQIKIDAQ